MDVPLPANVATAVNRTGSGDAVSIVMLAKALQMQRGQAEQLLEMLPPPPASKPPHLGHHVDTYA